VKVIGQAWATGLALCCAVAHGQTLALSSPGARAAEHPAGANHSAADSRAGVAQVLIQAPWLYNARTRYAHSMPEISGTQITVTRDTTVVKLDQQPPIINNQPRQLFDQLPGLVLAEQQNPTNLNLSYRGLGNPQESEYLLLLQDGIPMEMDFIGYPTLYYLPNFQSISQVQMIRGGSGLLYGPQPEPVINFISRRPGKTTQASTDQVFGSDGLYSTYSSISGPAGRWDYLADFSHRHSNGQRSNGDYTVDSGDLMLGYRIDPAQKLSLAVHAYALASGMPGLLSGAEYRADPSQTSTPDDRDWAHRYTAVLTYRNQIDHSSLFVQKLWTGYQDLVTRAGRYAAGGPVLATGATLASQKFHYTGLDGRFLHHWGHGSAFTLGYTAYASNSPYTEIDSANALIAPYGASGALFYHDQRRTRYVALFGENLYRFGRFHVVTSARIDHEQLYTRETVAPHPNLAHGTFSRTIPLFGIGFGNDFGRGNETYFNLSQGYRPVRYLDIASPFSNFAGVNNPASTHYLTYEAGVHGWPKAGLYYDASVFQINATNEIETEQLTPTETIDVNSGDLRSRGVEASGAYDLLRLWPDVSSAEHLTVFANVSLLNAKFTSSRIPGQTGKVPAYAPHYVLKGGVTLRGVRGVTLSLMVDAVGAQYFQNSDTALGSTPALIPAYTVADLSGQYAWGAHWRIEGGVSNLGNHRYYSRVFLFGGMLEPALTRQFYLGIAYHR
jgi:Fe(3+) dicitrate transport protein